MPGSRGSIFGSSLFQSFLSFVRRLLLFPPFAIEEPKVNLIQRKKVRVWTSLASWRASQSLRPAPESGGWLTQGRKFPHLRWARALPTLLLLLHSLTLCSGARSSPRLTGNPLTHFWLFSSFCSIGLKKVQVKPLIGCLVTRSLTPQGVWRWGECKHNQNLQKSPEDWRWGGRGFGVLTLGCLGRTRIQVCGC